jgi:glycosyltransferase involved in cell wall biosynthesis
MSRRLRIGFVSIHDACDVEQWSGIPSHVLEAFRKLDVDVQVISPLSQRIKYLLAPAKLMARFTKSKASLDHYPLVIKSYARQITRAIRKQPVDVIVSMSSIPIAYLRCEEPIIFWTDAVFHAMFDYYTGAFQGMGSAAIARARLQEETALARCTFAAYASTWAADGAKQLTDPGKIFVLPFGASVAIEHTAQDVEAWAKRKRQVRPKSCNLLFLGVDWNRKGGAVAVESAKILNERGVPTKLTVVGCQPPDAVPDFVQVLGFVSKSTEEGRQKLKTLLWESDFLILPSVAEAAGIVFCEASAFGLPSLSYATGGVPDYVRNGVNGVCLPIGSSAADFADAVSEILRVPGMFEKLSAGAFHEYESRLNWDSSVRLLVDLCHRAFESVSSTRGNLEQTEALPKL